MLRQDELCESIRDCLEATTVQCQRCETLWAPPDIRMPDACPNCGAVRQYMRVACDQCPKALFSQRLTSSGLSELINQAFFFANWLAKGGSLTLDELTPQECSALQILWQEQSKAEIERAQKAQREASRGYPKVQASYKTRPI